MSEYRREHQRFPTNDSVTLLLGDGQKRSLIMRDLSCRGAGLFGDFGLLVSQELTLFMKSALLPEPLTRRGRVAWSLKVDGNLWQSGIDFGLDNKISF